MKSSYIIGISGGSGSGKTTLANHIIENSNPDNILLLEFDNYYRHGLCDGKEASEVNFDHPDAIESGLIYEHIRNLKSGIPVNMPKYDFTTHSREGYCEVQSKRIIILEGIFTFCFKDIKELLDIKLFVDTPDDIRFIRRLKRDVSERGRDIDDVISQYLNTVQPMYLEYIKPTIRYADIIISERGFNPTVELISALLREKIAEK